ncbi:MAG: DUF4974 domain-containing protein [Prolixibacteraceae bacterium]|jgi:ferric-dicitrate binding protein FerR (iron transport regulator)|nr:DUF4974 domain-containing protein [Prolixibacteraceae bacterium]
MPKEHSIIDFEIIWKKINGNLIVQEELFLSKWLDESPLHRQFYDNAIHYYQEGSNFSDAKLETEKAWESLLTEISKESRSRSRWINPVSAVVFATILIAGLIWSFSKTEMPADTAQKAQQIKPGTNQAILVLHDGSVHNLSTSVNLILNEDGAEIKGGGTKLQYTEKIGAAAEIKYNTLNIPRGGEFFLQLADGTNVWLNSETTLRYPVQFSGNERRVELSGEAYFEVAKNEKIPFVVESGEQMVKVLGTKFNISSYKENQVIYTTLVNGSIEVSIKGKPEIAQILVPNEQSTIDVTEGKISKRTVDPYQFIAWKEGRFVFQDQTLETMMKTMSKWYDIEVVFASENLRNMRFTGNLRRYDDFGEVLNKIKKTNEVDFDIDNKIITLK